MDEAASVILACRRLLCQQTETHEETRSAVAACDQWLDKYHQAQSLQLSRKPSRLPTELVVSILRNFRGQDRETKTTLLTCRLVNKEWRQLAWTRFCLPQLAVLDIDAVPRGRIEWDTVDRCEGYGGARGWGRLWRDTENATWKSGFANLKSLKINLDGGEGNVFGFDLLDVMAAHLGENLESLAVTDDNRPAAMDSFFRKLVGKCPNLKKFDVDGCLGPLPYLPLFIKSLSRLVCLNLVDVDFSKDWVKSVIGACVHLKCLGVYPCRETEERLIAFLDALPKLRRILTSVEFDDDDPILKVASAKNIAMDAFFPVYEELMEEHWMGW
ncbi:hypothetical protein HK104_000438 [Borealophlyctis nickersoniae]|nr:hypothetical protein HK104_000438 [Borealophlyctis nickersoniae]